MTAPYIRPATFADAEAICAIYNPYVLDSSISFEEQAVHPDEMANRIRDVADMDLPWLVLCVGQDLLGYAYATRWRARPAYRYAVETSIYIAAQAGGRGLGTQLYQALLRDLQARELHTAIAGVAQPNPASNALHTALGFSQVANFREVGRKFGQWLDVAYWQLPLSESVGPDTTATAMQPEKACQ